MDNNNTLAHFAINADDIERAALQGRRQLVAGTRTIGFECTIGVPSIDKTEAAVKAAGGKVLLERSVIVGVGTLMFFQDPERNLFGAMQYDRAAE
jgi:hypothetical protein